MSGIVTGDEVCGLDRQEDRERKTKGLFANRLIGPRGKDLGWGVQRVCCEGVLNCHEEGFEGEERRKRMPQVDLDQFSLPRGERDGL